MSRVYFHSPSGDAEIRGSERAWLRHVAAGPGMYAWDLDRAGDYDRAYTLLGMSPEPPPGEFSANYLHAYMREAKAEDERYRQASVANRESGLAPVWAAASAQYDPEPVCRFIAALKTSLRVNGFEVHVGEYRLHTGNITLNTALAAGSDVIALAAKIDGWCEAHAYVEGPDRAWLAGLVQRGLDDGIFRRGIWYRNADGANETWAPQGWDELIPFLRARDDEPVVMSYSACDQFPGRSIADWEPPPPPADWCPWADEERGIAEWEALDEPDRDSHRKEHQQEAWHELAAAEQWDRAMRGLREKRPWARISPETLRAVGFGPRVTVYDLFAVDRDERITRAFNSEGEES